MKKVLAGLVIVLSALGAYNYNLSKRVQELEHQQDIFKQQEKNCIKEALWHEARNQGYEGIVAVMSVIENRKNHPKYPGTYCSVIWQPKQFSYKQKGSGDKLDDQVSDYEKPVLHQINAVADQAVEGKFEPVLPSSVLWYTTSKVKNYWTKTKRKIKKIKDHVFYSDKEKTNAI